MKSVIQTIVNYESSSCMIERDPQNLNFEHNFEKDHYYSMGLYSTITPSCNTESSMDNFLENWMFLLDFRFCEEHCSFFVIKWIADRNDTKTYPDIELSNLCDSLDFSESIVKCN